MKIPAFALAALLAGLSSLLAQPASSPPRIDTSLWPEEQRAFFEDGPGLLLGEARRAELAAADPAARERFIREFLAQDLEPATPVNELALGIENRKKLAGAEFPSPRDVRWQLVFLNGAPAAKKVIDCGTAFRPIEIWTYRRGPEDEGRILLYRPLPGEPFRAWDTTDSKRVLYTPEMEYWLEQWEELRGRITGRRFDQQICKEAIEIDRVTGLSGLTGARAEKRDEELVPERRRYGRRPGTAGDSLLAPPRDLAAWAREAAAEKPPAAAPVLTVNSFDLYFPARAGQRMQTRAVLQVVPKGRKQEPPPEGVEGAQPKEVVQLTVDGVVESEGRIFEELRFRYRVPAPAMGEPVAVAVDCSLRPRFPFVLRLRIKDEVDGAEAVVSRGFVVPAEPVLPPATEIAGVGPENQEATRRAAGLGYDSLTLLPPESDVVLGLFRAEALVTGERIVRVGFFVDGRQQLVRGTKPYSVELRLARYPVEQVVRAEGYDKGGQIVAADEIVINQPRGGLAINIVEPKRGSRPQGKVKARAEITVPEERQVTSVEFRVNDQVVATLTRPPWEAVVDPASTEEIVYLTVVAYLDDGSRREELRFLKAPQNLEEVEVNLIELFAAVTDSKGDLVRGLTQADFEVLEGGKPQRIDRFELVENLPLTVGIVLDTSGSMASSLSEAQQAASDFLRNVVRRGDRLFALSFSDRPALRMPLTDDVEAAVTSLSSLQAVGSTSLHDALVHSLYYFRGTRGQRALVLLSDGDDTSSQLNFDETLEYARRTGVSIYSIGLNIGASAFGVRTKLGRLAETTGGRTFYVSSAAELRSVYAEIGRELRSRYLIAFNSNVAAGSGGYRPVEIKVKRSGLKARSARGYSP